MAFLESLTRNEKGKGLIEVKHERGKHLKVPH